MSAYQRGVAFIAKAEGVVQAPDSVPSCPSNENPGGATANGEKCFSFWEAELWNSLPAESKPASSLNGSKKSIKGNFFRLCIMCNCK